MKILEKIGLSANESTIYTTLLKLGTAEVREISRKSDIKRPTVYFCLEKLIKLGIVVENVKKGKKTYTATDPEELLSLINKQKTDLEEQEKGLLAVLPKLKSLSQETDTSAEVRVYEGVQSLWKLGQELMREHHDFLFVYSGETVLKYITAEQLLKNFTKKRRQIGGSKVYAISDYNPISEKRLREGDTEFRELKILKKPITFDSIFCLCGHKIVLVSLAGNPKAVVIENEPIAQILNFLFWSLWETLE